MDSPLQRQLQSTNPVKSLSDPVEKERILMQYGGIFKHQIHEFAKKIQKAHRKIPNYSR